MDLSKKILSDIIVYSRYSRFLPEVNRRETWEELVTRNMDMHIKKYPKLESEIRENYKLVFDKKVLPSARALQFSGKPIEISPTRQYNCAFCPVDSWEVFSEVMFLLLNGTGVGYSVQFNHIHQLPEIHKPKSSKRFLVGDSIEGWADAVRALVKAYFLGTTLPDFDFRDIRPKGAILKTAGGRAPGPEGLEQSLIKIKRIFDSKSVGDKLRPIEVHDTLCHIADSVLSGGIRRSSLIALFSWDDQEMLTCKFGKWYEKNPQRANANNSAVAMRWRIRKKDFFEVWKQVQESGSGEPGIFFSNDYRYGTNPCNEVGLRPYQFCNLTEINASDISSQEELNVRSSTASFIGTLQASYTNFHYLRDVWQLTTEKEALIGCGMTGIGSGAVLQFDLGKATKEVLKENARVSKILGINQAARTTVVKPSGTSSLVLGSSSGIHAWFDKFYTRRVRFNKEEPIYKYLKKELPTLIEDDVFKPNTQAILSIPVAAPEGAILRSESALELLSRVERFNLEWIRSGHRSGSNYNNVSTTVSVKDHEWEEVGEWMWDNRDSYSGLSVLPYDGGHYVQAPHETISEETFNKMSAKLKDLDLTKAVEYEDNTTLKENVACAGGVCEV